MNDFSTIVTLLFLLLVTTSFAKIVTVLSVLRLGVGLKGSGFGVVVVGVSVLLTAFVMQDQFNVLSAKGLWQQERSIAEQTNLVQTTLQPFLTKHADEEVTDKILALRRGLDGEDGEDRESAEGLEVTATQREATSAEIAATGAEGLLPVSAEPTTNDSVMSLSALSLSFMVTELGEAFKIAFFILVPFLVIDLLTINALAVLGVGALSPQLVAFPIKILLFYALDGWLLITEKLVTTYL